MRLPPTLAVKETGAGATSRTGRGGGRKSAALRGRTTRRSTLLAVAVATLALAAATRTETWRGFEERAQGLLLRLRGPEPHNPALRLVVMEDAAFERYQGRIPRERLTHLVRALNAADVRAVAFDFVFTTPAWRGVENDAMFAEALSELPVAVLGVHCMRAGPEGSSPQLSRHVLGARGATPATPCRRFRPSVSPLAEAGLPSHVEIVESFSGYARATFALAESPAGRLASMGLAVHLALEGKTLDDVEQRSDAVVIGDLEVPVGPEGAVATGYRGLYEENIFALRELIDALGDDGLFPAELASRFAGGVVLFAVGSEAMGDSGPLIQGSRGPISAVHAALLSDLLDGRPMREASTPLQIGLLVLLALAGLLGARTLRGLLGLLWPLVGALCVAWLTVALSRRGLLVEPLGPAFAVLVAFGVSALIQLGLRERERGILTHALGAYVDRRVLERVLDDPERYLALGGARKTLSVLFSDIQGFTELSNRLAPDVVIGLLRECLEAMARLITAQGGRIDKIMGDGILAVFGDPLEQADHALHAVDCAVAMQREMAILRRGWMERGLPELRIRVGVATGDVFVGNIGSEASKLEYTVLGATVNLAARLEGQAPPHGVLVSEATAESLGDRFELHRVGELTLKGFEGERTALLVMGRRDEDGRRGAARLPAGGGVLLHGVGAPRAGRILDVSATGLLVKLETADDGLAAGSALELEFPDATVRWPCEVRWSAAGEQGMLLGISLIEGNDNEAASFLLRALGKR